jgi:uncharacterized membrane protein
MQPTSQLSRLSDNKTLLVMLGIGAAAAYAGYSMAKSATQNRVAFRPDDDAPARTARDHPVAGRTITINKPRAELFAFWSDFSNLSQFMQSVKNVALHGDVAEWEIAAPMGRTVTLRTIMTERRDDEFLAWSSTEASDMKVAGRITFRDAPAGRGTEIEAEINYEPPLGEVGRWIGKLFQTDPVIQGRRELRRFKMLMETGEIATNINHKSQA